MTHFIYCPKSGDRVFVELQSYEVKAIRWPNGSRHIIGGTHLEVVAACPGRWWRNEAKTLATAIVQAAGGIAWDQNGTINLIVPEWAAPRSATLLIRAAGPRIDGHDIDALGIAAGARLDSGSGQFARAEYWNRPVFPDLVQNLHVTFNSEKIAVRDDDGDIYVQAPATWGVPTLDGIPLPVYGEWIVRGNDTIVSRWTGYDENLVLPEGCSAQLLDGDGEPLPIFKYGSTEAADE